MKHKPLKEVNKKNCRMFNLKRFSRRWWKLLLPEHYININSLLIIILLLLHFCDCMRDISQMSPKSSVHLNENVENTLMTKTPIALESTVVLKASTELSVINSYENSTKDYIRIMRSAEPILNDKNHRNISPNNVHISEKYIGKEDNVGRYFQYNIQPTETYDTEMDDTDKIHRSGKILKSSSVMHETSTMAGYFLVNGDLRQKAPITTMSTSISMSGSPHIQTKIVTKNSVSLTAATVTVTPPHSPRQNTSPDIQDIITGIVKLLNGNVNVHANTHGIRRPTATRINNRGPPRISDVQTVPLDYDNQKPSNIMTSLRPSLYPFERPERPFITGVPIPEQIVPYRPNFVSNRPPWHRNKPRPSISTNSVGGRRPIPQYKPMSTSQIKPVQEGDHQLTGPENFDGSTHAVTTLNDTYGDTVAVADNITHEVDIHISNLQTDLKSLEQSSDINYHEDYQPLPSVQLTKKEDTTVKKKPSKYKTNEKKKHTVTTIEDQIAPDVHLSSKYISMSVDSINLSNNDNSTEEVIFMTASKTPDLDDVKASETILNTTISTSSTKAIKHLPTKSHDIEELKSQINPTLTTSLPILTTSTNTTSYYSTLTTTTITTSTSIATTTEASLQLLNTSLTTTITPTLPIQYHPRPGIVLDDPEFKPGGGSRPRPQRPSQAQHPVTHINPTRQQLPPGYGEIFDVTLSAVQGPDSKGGSQHTINIKPYGTYNHNSNQDIIISAASGEETFVSIDGTRTYINLFGDPIDPPNIDVLKSPISDKVTTSTLKPDNKEPLIKVNSGVSVSGLSSGKKYSSTPEAIKTGETDVVDVTQAHNKKISHYATTTNTGVSLRPHYRPRTTQPPIRIDTCIVGDDTTCDQAQHEYCKTENGVSSCHCRPGHSRRKHREPCRRVITFCIGMRVDRIYEHRIVWDNKLADRHSEPYSQLSYESIRALDSAMSMTPYSDEFMEAKVNNIYHIEGSTVLGSGVFVNLTIKLDENVETLRPNLRSDVQKHLLGVLHRRNNNIGKSVLFVATPEAAITPLKDLDECRSRDLNDCHQNAICSNVWGSFRCTCSPGTRDHWADQPHRAGRACLSCPDAYCNNRGTCNYNAEGTQLCVCDGGHYGSQCEIDGEVLGVAIGASVAAVIIIVLTLICLVMWSRRWQREQKNAIDSSVFGYMSTAPLKSTALLQSGYQLTLEDRMRWAQVADVMSPSNYYGTEPIGPTRPSSAMFAYPNLQVMDVSTLTGMPMQSRNSKQQLHQNATLVAPPVPMPRLGVTARTNATRTLENSSSSEEEDRTDLLGRNFQVPRPKSRSNGSITNQSGIYYDVDYEPSGNGIGSTSVDRLYGSQNQSSTHSHVSSNQILGPQGIPMSTYTSGRAPSTYYMK